ncbi:MAG: TetR/AcrR family transcriptional regulator [Candidatus Thorarchaeota archaeon]
MESRKKKVKEKMTRKERETQLRKQIILEAAEKLFLSERYEATTMDEIANEAEFSKGTVYKYFNSKDELYIAIGIKAYELIIRFTREFAEKEDPGLKQIIAVGYAYYEFTKQYPLYANIFHDIALKLPDIAIKSEETLSEIERDYLNLSNSYRDIFIKILTDAIKIKAIRSDKNPFLIGYILSSLTNGLVNDLMQNKNFIERLGLHSDEIVDFVFEILGEGLSPREN